jgi:hypothetical protein
VLLQTLAACVRGMRWQCGWVRSFFSWELVGHEGAVCTTVSLARQEAQCVATYSFGGAQITAQALITLRSLGTVRRGHHGRHRQVRGREG